MSPHAHHTGKAWTDLAQICFHVRLALQKGPVLPTIIIDEASQLQPWKEF